MSELRKNLDHFREGPALSRVSVRTLGNSSRLLCSINNALKIFFSLFFFCRQTITVFLQWFISILLPSPQKRCTKKRLSAVLNIAWQNSCLSFCIICSQADQFSRIISVSRHVIQFNLGQSAVEVPIYSERAVINQVAHNNFVIIGKGSRPVENPKKIIARIKLHEACVWLLSFAMNKRWPTPTWLRRILVSVWTKGYNDSDRDRSN